MSKSRSRISAYRGPAIVLVLAATLIAALAIPFASSPISHERPTVDFTAKQPGTVSEILVKDGELVKQGQTLLVLQNPELDAQIQALELKLKELEASSKTAVVESEGLGLGMIGTLPRVVYESYTTKAPMTPLTVAKKDSSQLLTQLSASQKSKDKLDTERKSTQLKIEELEGQLQEAIGAITLAETNVESAEASSATAAKDQERMQRLYDMGAIPKKKLDASVDSASGASQAVTAAKQAVSDVKARKEGLEASIKDAKQALAKIEAASTVSDAEIAKLKAKANAVDSEPVKIAKMPAVALPKRRIVYGTAPVENLAPVKVSLVDSANPETEKSIETLQMELEALKAQKANLVITSPITGWIRLVKVAVGATVSSGDVLIVCES